MAVCDRQSKACGRAWSAPKVDPMRAAIRRQERNGRSVRARILGFVPLPATDIHE